MAEPHRKNAVSKDILNYQNNIAGGNIVIDFNAKNFFTDRNILKSAKIFSMQAYTSTLRTFTCIFNFICVD